MQAVHVQVCSLLQSCIRYLEKRCCSGRFIKTSPSIKQSSLLTNIRIMKLCSWLIGQEYKSEHNNVYESVVWPWTYFSSLTFYLLFITLSLTNLSKFCFVAKKICFCQNSCCFLYLQTITHWQKREIIMYTIETKWK